VSALWFYKDSNKDDDNFLETYNKVATELKGMVKICAINCADYDVFCEKQGVKTTPTVMIYPMNPMPAFKYEGKMETKALSGKVVKFVQDQSIKLTKDNVDTFLSSDITKPKVLLFSNKKTPPTIWKALSSETVFRRTVKFGFVNEEEKDLVSKFKVKSFPAVIMQRGSKSEVKDQYKGDMTFLGLKDWVNLHSESGMGDKVQGAGNKEEETIEEAKPWLVQEVPELHGKSANDICFKGEGLCVIYLKDGQADSKDIDMLTGLSKKFTSQLSDRGAKMKWMWMDLKQEDAFQKMFAPVKMPSAVVFNPHKRLRFSMMDHGEDNEFAADESTLTKLMDKVLGGDARFKMVPGQKLPTWATRESKDDKKDAKKGKKEL